MCKKVWWYDVPIYQGDIGDGKERYRRGGRVTYPHCHRATCWNVEGAGSGHPGAQRELGCGPPWNSAELTTSDQTMRLDQYSEPL